MLFFKTVAILPLLALSVSADIRVISSIPPARFASTKCWCRSSLDKAASAAVIIILLFSRWSSADSYKLT